MVKVELADSPSDVHVVVHHALVDCHQKSRLKVGEEQAVQESRDDVEHQRELTREVSTWSLKARMKHKMQRTVSHMLVSMIVRKE